MRALILLAFLVSSHVFAGEYVPKKLQFNFLGDDMGNRIYYRCEVVKTLVANHLESLGAISTNVKCYGGLEDYARMPQWSPITVTAHFEVPLPAENSVHEVVVLKTKGVAFEDCFLNTSFLKTAIPLFPGVKVLKKSTSCLSNYSRWSYTVEIAK